jgi:hypothetical protein
MIQSKLLQSLAHPSQYCGEPVRISCLGVVTSNRTYQLRRCLLTYVKEVQRHGRACEIAVMDDSGDAGARRLCGDWLRHFARRFGVSVFYAGWEEKREYIHRLAVEGVPLDLAKFLLTNSAGVSSSPGSNRNALLLQAGGEAFLSCDDDSICAPRDLRQGGQSVAAVPFSDTADRIRYVPDRVAAHMAVPSWSGDLLASHEQILGRPLRDLLLPVRNTASVSLSRVGHRVMHDLTKGQGRALVTVSGVVGDSGLPHPAVLMTATGAARLRFLQCWDGSRDWNLSRNVILGWSRPAVTQHGPLAMTTATGFCSRVTLPPFIPSGRGEDTLFGLLLRKCYPDGYIGHVPVALRHAPEPGRAYGALPTAPRLSDLISMVVYDFSDVSTDPASDRLKAIGEYLVACGGNGTADFGAFLDALGQRWRFGLVDRCEALLNSYRGTPPHWAREMRRWVAGLERGLMRRGAGLPIDMGCADSLEARCERTRRFMLNYGETLRWWPAILAASQKLRADGYRIGVALM